MQSAVLETGAEAVRGTVVTHVFRDVDLRSDVRSDVLYCRPTWRDGDGARTPSVAS